MKYFFLSLALVGSIASAQSVNSAVDTASTSGANNVNIIEAANPLDRTRNEFRTNQAQSGPAIIGGAAPSAGGCGAVDGWSVSVAVANGGKSNAQEMPGCMLNLLTDRMNSLTVNTAGKFDGLSVMKLEAWCLYPLYQQAIENAGLYECKATRDARAAALMGVTLAPAGSRDEYKAARGY